MVLLTDVVAEKRAALQALIDRATPAVAEVAACTDAVNNVREAIRGDGGDKPGYVCVG